MAVFSVSTFESSEEIPICVALNSADPRVSLFTWCVV